MQPHRLQRAGRREQDREARQRHGERAAVEDLPLLDAAVEAKDAVRGETHEPPRGQPEGVEQQLRDPRADGPALVEDRAPRAAEERPGIAAVVGGEDEREVRADSEEDDPAGLAQDAGKAWVRGFAWDSDSAGGSSRLMIVIDFDSMEMKPRSERSFRMRFPISPEAPPMLARSAARAFRPPS